MDPNHFLFFFYPGKGCSRRAAPRGGEYMSEAEKRSDQTPGGMNPEEEIELYARKGSVKYVVTVSSTGIVAEEIVSPLPGWGNCFGDCWEIVLVPGKKYAKVIKSAWNNGYARAGHGMTESWVEARGYMPTSEAREFIESIKARLAEIENDSPDVIQLFKQIKNVVEENSSLDDDDD